jgi:hypothetical protein
MATRICIDVDGTIVDANENLLPGIAEGLHFLKEKGYCLTLWSFGGEQRAREIARRHHLNCYFDEYATKPDLVVDDDIEEVSQLPAVDVRPSVRNSQDWTQIAANIANLAEALDNHPDDKAVPEWIRAMKNQRSDSGVQASVAIWNKHETYIRWPVRSGLLWPGLTRHPDGDNRDCYAYAEALLNEIKAAGLPFRNKNNDPAIYAYLLAGGDRPMRPFPDKWGWAIHHIYDGRHPAPASITDRAVPRAVSDGNLFTHSGGLVAIHPLADYVATNEPLLAWLLRWEAFRRFGFDPMGIFVAKA